MAMRALVTAAPLFQDAALARRSVSSVDTSDWRGCGFYDPSYLAKYTLPTGEGPACPPGAFCAVSGRFADCLPYAGGTVRTTCVDLLTICSNCEGSNYVSCGNTANPYCLTWHYGAAITAYGCGPEQQEGSVISPDLTPWYPPTDGIPSALLTEASITLVQGAPTFFPSSTTSLSTSEQSAGVMPTTVVLATSTQFPIQPTTSTSASTKVGVRLGITIAALVIFAVVLI